MIIHIFDNPNDHTNIELLYCNSTKQDILLFDQLNQLQKKYSNRIKITFAVSQEKGDIQGLSFKNGRISKKMIQDHLSHSEKFYVCGPTGMLNAVTGKKLFFGRFSKGYLQE